MKLPAQEETLKLIRRFAAWILLGSDSDQAEDSFELLQARLDVLNVLHGYMDAANRRDPVDFGRNFTEDGQLALYLPTGKMLRESKGRAAIGAAGKADWDESTYSDGFFEDRHNAFHTYFVNLSTTSADTRTSFAITRLDRPEDPAAAGPAAAGKPFFRYTGVYKTHLVKTNEGWKIERREIHFD
jgi:hypothetical protein